MAKLTREFEILNNPAFVAVLVWRICCGYSRKEQPRAPFPIELLFVLVPVLLSHSVSEILRKTNRPSGLRGFVAKFYQPSAGREMLAGLHYKAIEKRKIVLRGIRVAVAAGLIEIDRRGRVVGPLTYTMPGRFEDSIKRIAAQAEKLGGWSRDFSISEVSRLFGMEL